MHGVISLYNWFKLPSNSWLDVNFTSENKPSPNLHIILYPGHQLGYEHDTAIERPEDGSAPGQGH